MNRFVPFISKAAAIGIFVVATGVSSFALAAGTGGTATSGTSMGGPTKTATAVTHTAKPKMAKKTSRMKASAEVKAVQEALNRTGAKLHLDGMLGPKTRAALKKYQKDHKLKATGRIDKATRASLKA